MTVYVDEILLENFILNFIILYATGLISKSRIRFFKIALGSIIGSVYTLIYYNFQSNIYINIISKIILSIVMIYISYTPENFKSMSKLIIFFYLTSFVFGGAAFSVIYMVNTGKISIHNGILIGSYTIKTILVGIIIAFIIIVLAFKFIKSKFNKKDLLCDIKIKINEKEIKTKALVDTGNMLKEPITNIPVIVVEHKLLYDIVPREILDNIENILGGDLKNITENIKNEYMSKLKVIPFTSLGKENGMLLGLKADGVEVETTDNVKNIDKVIIGIYNKKISKNEKYRALLGIDMV